MDNEQDGARMQTGGAVDSLTAPTAEQRATHTPGPWALVEDSDLGMSENGGPVWKIEAANRHGSLMADCKYYPWVPENKFDWHLIAAAPDLLAALKAVSRSCVDACWCEHAIGNPMMPVHSAACKQARAAVAKAEGR